MERNTDNIIVLASKRCEKHGLPLRKNQRNCHECNREANRRYRESLRADLELGRAMRRELGPTRKSDATLKKMLRMRPSRPGFVYFIQADPGDEIKIGFSVDPKKRLKHLQVAATRELHILATMPGMYDHEYAIHQRFATHRTIGEWFRPADEILAFIDELRAPKLKQSTAS